MQPVSERFKQALSKSHKVISKIELHAGDSIIELSGTGEVSVDANAAISRRCKLTIADPTGELTPVNSYSALTPFSNELRLFRGIEFVDGTTELVPLGVFGISDVTPRETNEGVTLEVEGLDRSHMIQRARFINPHVIASGTNYATAIRQAIAARNPWAEFDFIATSATTPQIILGQERDHDPWKEAQAMATAIGCDLFISVDGIVTLRQFADIEQSVWTYAPGETSMLLGTNRKLSSDATYNHVVVSGEAVDGNPAPVLAEAKDTDPTSPTYVFGPFGDVPYFFPSTLITTESQALTAANTILQRVMGRQEAVEFPALVNPAHEAGDVITIESPRAKIADNYVLDSFNIPLSAAGQMRAVTRKRQVPHA